jgi:hypothetical protein
MFMEAKKKAGPYTEVQRSRPCWFLYMTNGSICQVLEKQQGREPARMRIGREGLIRFSAWPLAQ